MYTQKDLDKYLQDDFILVQLQKYPEDNHFTSQKWLLDMPEKRMIYADVYGKLLKTNGKRILDIGGGFSGLTRELIKNHQYTLIDIMAHDDHAVLEHIEQIEGKFWENTDWNDFNPVGTYDYIIAHDLFPNVDQRLESFVKKFKPLARTMIVTLTCYEAERFYTVKRLDADEVMYIRPWNTDMLSLVLQKNSIRHDFMVKEKRESIFKNGRIVYKLILRNETY